MPNGSHSGGPSWGDIPNDRKIISLIRDQLEPVIKRIEVIEEKLANQPLHIDRQKDGGE